MKGVSIGSTVRRDEDEHVDNTSSIPVIPPCVHVSFLEIVHPSLRVLPIHMNMIQQPHQRTLHVVIQTARSPVYCARQLDVRSYLITGNKIVSLLQLGRAGLLQLPYAIKIDVVDLF